MISQQVGPRRGPAFFFALILGLALAPLACAQANFKAAMKKDRLHKGLASHSLFLAGRKANADLSYSFLPESALQTLTLKAQEKTTVGYKQMERPKVKDSFVQGHAGDEVKEEFPVAALDKLDLLLVVDSSSSMGIYQEKLSAGLPPFLSHISRPSSSSRTRRTAAATPIRTATGIPIPRPIISWITRRPRPSSSHFCMTPRSTRNVRIRVMCASPMIIAS